MTKKYRINGITYTQNPLTYGESKQMIALYEQMNIAEDEEITLDRLKELLIEGKLISDFMKIVLNPSKAFRYYLRRVKCAVTRSPFLDLGPVPVEMIEQIFEDFFLLNKKLLTRLASFTNVLGLIARTVIYATEKKSNGSTTSTKASVQPSAVGS